MDKILFKEAFKAGYKKAKRKFKDFQEILQHTEISWNYDSNMISFLKTPKTKFLVPFPSQLAKEVIDEHFDYMSNEDLLELIEKSNLNIEAKVDELQRTSNWHYPEIHVEIDLTAFVESYLELIENALERLVGSELNHLFAIKLINENTLLVGFERENEKALDYFLGESLEDPTFKELADMLDVWGDKLYDKKYLLQVLTYLALAEMNGIDTENEANLQSILNYSQGYIENELPRVAEIFITKATLI